MYNESMLKKIKKWHIAIIIVVGIGAFWLSNNMWIFEKKIAVENYGEYLIGTEWEEIKGENIWEFTKDDASNYSNIKSHNISYKGAWEIDNKILNADFIRYPSKSSADSLWEIRFLSKKHLLIQMVQPSQNVKIYKLKRTN